MATFTSVLRLLVTDPRSRRALDETLLDWQTELEAAGTRVARWSCNARSVAAIARTLVLSVPREARRSTDPALLGRVAVIALLPAALLVVGMTVADSYAESLRERSSQAASENAVRVAPDPTVKSKLVAGRCTAALAFFLPFSWFAATLRHPKRLSSRLGLATAAFLATLLYMCVVVPIASGYSFEYRLHHEDGRIHLPSIHFILVPPLMMVDWSGDQESFAVGLALATPALCAGLVLLAASLPERRRRVFMVIVPAALILLRLVPEGIQGEFLRIHYYLPALALSCALAIAAVLVVAARLTWREASEPVRASSEP